MKIILDKTYTDKDADVMKEELIASVGDDLINENSKLYSIRIIIMKKEPNENPHA